MLAVIYNAADGAPIAMYAIVVQGDLTPAATASATGMASINGVAFSQQRVTLARPALATISA